MLRKLQLLNYCSLGRSSNTVIYSSEKKNIRFDRQEIMRYCADKKR